MRAPRHELGQAHGHERHGPQAAAGPQPVTGLAVDDHRLEPAVVEAGVVGAGGAAAEGGLTWLGSATLSCAARATTAADTALASGPQSKGSSRPTPASGQAITLRWVWPQAERLVRPMASQAASTEGMERAATWCNSRFWRVVMCTQPSPWPFARSATARACAARPGRRAPAPAP